MLRDAQLTHKEESGDTRGIEANSATNARRAVLLASTLTAALAGFGLLARHQMIADHRAAPSGLSIFFRLYALHEGPFLIALEVFAILSLILLASTRSGRSTTEQHDSLPAPAAAPLWAVALGVGLASLGSAYLVFHRLLLSMDEFGPDFQARLFAHGRYATQVPWPWRSIGPAITPIYVGLDPATGRWLSQYLPVYALLKAPFVALGASSLLNPMLSVLAVIALASVARRLWPDEGLRPWIAVALLATSSQLIVTAGTGYSMPAHLLLNLIWLRLYQRGDARAWAAALGVGVLALGLHNPFPHALFVTPFLLRLVRDRRWARVGTAALAYGVGGAAWLAWLRFVYPVARGADGGLTTLFATPDLSAAWLHTVNLSLVLTWQAPVLAILAFAAVARPRRLEPLLADLALGVLLTVGFFTFFSSTQGHGWGYRYVYQVLGSLCLLAAAGVPTVRAAIGEVATRRWLAVGIGFALLVQVPLRLLQTERFVRPFAAANEYVRSRKAHVVLLEADEVWYGHDLLRNDPFLADPIVVSASMLSPGVVAAIEHTYPGRVERVTSEQLLQLGMTRLDRHRWFMGR